MSDQIKAEMSAKTLVGFFHLFGNDVYSQILLEELFEGLCNAETLFVLGEPGEERNETGDSSSERVSDNSEINESGGSGSSTGMAEEDWPDHQ